MSRIAWLFTGLAVAALFACLGCQGDPTGPDPRPPAEQDALSSTSGAGTHRSLGFYLLTIDADNGTVAVLPGRSTDWHFNLTGILNTVMGVSAAGVPGESDPANGRFVFDITLEHPFATKPQFSGFDVKGVLITPGSLTLGPLVFADIDETCLINADGFTRWWNPVEFPTPGVLGYTDGSLTGTPSGLLTATVNPYKLFADRLGPLDSLSWVTDEPLHSELGRAVFKAGESNTRRYDIQFPMDPGPQVRFGYAIDCSWNAPWPNPPTQVPYDFPADANQPEAYRVVLQPTVNSLYYDTETTTGGGVLRVQVNVHDWQGLWTDDMAGETNVVRVFAPGLMSGGVTADLLSVTTKKARYMADLTGVAVPTEAGEALVICRVESSDGSTYQQAAAPAPDDPISAYQVITVDVIDPTCESDSNNDFTEALELTPGEPVIDQVCLPDDVEDYYLFDIPAKHSITGDLILHCDTDTTRLSLYDSAHLVYEHIGVVDGRATISLDYHSLNAGSYYARVKAYNVSQIAPYVLEIDGELISPGSPVEITPPNLHCDPVRAWFHENYLILGGKRLWIYDISNPDFPEFVHVADIYVERVAVFEYPHLYLGDGRHVHYVDLTDPTMPVYYPEILEYDHFKDFSALCMNSTHLYASVHDSMVWDDFVNIYDYTPSPASPVFVETFDINGRAESMALTDPEGPATKLATAYGDIVESWDVEDPSTVTFAGSYSIGSSDMLCVTGRENYLYVAGYRNVTMQGFFLVIEQQGSTMRHAGTTTIPGDSRAIDIEWPYVCIASGENGRTVCNVETPTSPVNLGTRSTLSDGVDVAMHEGVACTILQGQGFEIFDYTNVMDPPLYRKMVLNNCCRIIPKGDYLLALDRNHAIKVLSLWNPESPLIATECWIFTGLSMGEIDGDTLIVAGYENWHLLDATTPCSIGFHSYTSEVANISAIGIHANAAYVAFYDHSVRIYDISTPSTPLISNTIALWHTARDFTFYNDYAFITTNLGVEIYLVSDPLNPVYKNTFSKSSAIYNASVTYGELLYVTTKLELEIVVISDPANPIFQGTETLPAPSNDGYNCLTVDEPFLYTAGDMTEPVSVYVRPSSSPATIGKIYEEPSHGPHDIYTRDGILYVATHHRGLMVFDLY